MWSQRICLISPQVKGQALTAHKLYYAWRAEELITCSFLQLLLHTKILNNTLKSGRRSQSQSEWEGFIYKTDRYKRVVKCTGDSTVGAQLTETKQQGKTTGTASDINWLNSCRGGGKTRQMERNQQDTIKLSSDTYWPQTLKQTMGGIPESRLCEIPGYV